VDREKKRNIEYVNVLKYTIIFSLFKEVNHKRTY